MNNKKVLKKGELIFKEKDSLNSIYLIKSGRVILFLERSGKKIELEQLKSAQVLGEGVILDQRRQICSAEAASNVTLLEIPIEVLKKQYEKSVVGVKLVFKSLIESLHYSRQQVRSFKMKTDTTPCPQIYIPKVFGMLTLVAFHRGKKTEEGATLINWGALKIYVSRVFMGSPQRMRSCLDILEKLGFASLKFEKNEKSGVGEEVLTDIILHDLKMLEDFCEFYQFNLYKGSRAEVIHLNQLAFQMAKALVHFSADIGTDSRGLVSLDYNQLVKNIKKKFRFNVKETHIRIIEKKGLFIKRAKVGEAIQVFFNKNEFISTFNYWQIMNEIELWNEKGFVDKTHTDKAEPEAEVRGNDNTTCSECDAEVQEGQVFCGLCGFKLAA